MIKRRNFVNLKIIFCITILVLFIVIGCLFFYNGSKQSDLLSELDSMEDKNVKFSNISEEKTDYTEIEYFNIDAIPVFKQSSISDEIAEKIKGVSWKEESPVKLEDLAYINITYWGFDDKEHIGEMIVHKKLAEEIIDIFKDLYDAKFPIEKIRLIDEYDANDDLSMADNNTSAFCSREVTGSKGVFSMHSYGIAIDINPVQNPYVKGDIVLPKQGREYLDRDNVRKGMIVKGDVCYNAFVSRGWTWGGDWNSLKDYQHFEKEINLD